MANKVIVTKADLESLGDSIRAKAGTTNKMTVKAMKTAVDGIQTGGSSNSKIDGLYQTGAVELYRDFGNEAVDGMLITSWDDFVANNKIFINDGVLQPGKIVPNLPPKNEYGFYFGVIYDDGFGYGVTFFEDGSIEEFSYGETSSYPAGSAVYSQGTADMTNPDLGYDIAYFSEDGMKMTWYDYEYTVGATVQFEGDLIIPNANVNGILLSYQFLLTGIVVPNSITSIGADAFYGCSSLTSITIPDSVTSIVSCAFYECISLTSITIPDSVTSIGSQAFSDCTSLTSIKLSDSLTSIEPSIFYNCTSLTSITIPDSVTSIGEYVFYNCTSLTSITIPDSVTSIEANAFYECSSLTSITIPDSVTSIGSSAFSRCSSLTSIKLPDSATSIESYTFSGCQGLKSVFIPNSVKTIGQYAFRWCTNLENINYNGTKSQWKDISIDYNWNMETGNYIITCTDGAINKDGTEN